MKGRRSISWLRECCPYPSRPKPSDSRQQIGGGSVPAANSITPTRERTQMPTKLKSQAKKTDPDEWIAAEKERQERIDKLREFTKLVDLASQVPDREILTKKEREVVEFLVQRKT